MASDFQSIFADLRAILQRHCDEFAVSQDTSKSYCLEGPTGPATVRSWGGKVKRPTIPVAWVAVGKAYVSYHLMGVYANPKLLNGMSKSLQARMQGKSCFNFKAADAVLFEELADVTAKSLAVFRDAGFVTQSSAT